MRFFLPTLALLLATAPTALAAPDLTGSLGQQLERAVRHRAQLGESADVHVAAVRIASSPRGAQATSVKRIELPTGEDGLGRVAAKALLVGADGTETWTWIQAQVDASVPTVVATRTLQRGSTLGTADVALTMLPVERQRVTRVAETIGQVLKRSVRAGEPLRSTWLSPPIAVHRGDQVETVVRRGRVVARGSGEAIERGGVGDIIRIRVAQSRRILRARVLAKQRVEVIR
ncbi:MAG: flagellar basal body P-ring formation chaperone FlgA [Myxococcota bacterium]|jgi:flagella basal body P-ring formation protein FlgA|nr:flagellar basal body P-ring formation chaperone FlgA [Myxococcota bacterium]